MHRQVDSDAHPRRGDLLEHLQVDLVRLTAATVDLFPWVPEERYDVIVASLYQTPVDRAVAEFVGEAVVLPAIVADGEATCALGLVAVQGPATPGAASVMIRPEQLRLGRSQGARLVEHARRARLPRLSAHAAPRGLAIACRHRFHGALRHARRTARRRRGRAR